MEQAVSMTLPAILNLFDVVSARPYYGSPEYREGIINRILLFFTIIGITRLI